jgi:cytohesin
MDIEAIEELLEKNPNLVNARRADLCGFTPLELVVLQGSEPRAVEAAQLLISKGADVNAKDDNGNTPLHHAADGNCEEMARLLIKAGADPNTKGELGATPLHRACRRAIPDVPIPPMIEWRLQNVSLVALLLSEGASLKDSDDYGDTPLLAAVCQRFPHLELVTLLLDRGADVDAGDNDQWTSAHDAAAAGNSEVLELLLAKGANMNLRSKTGWTPLSAAAFYRRANTVQILLARGAEIDVFAAAALGMADHVKQVLDSVPTVVTSRFGGYTLLHAAAGGGHDSIVKLLLAKGAHVDAATEDGETALHWAARNGHAGACNLLLNAGADPTAQAAEWALCQGHEALAKLLADRRQPPEGAE